MEKRYLQTATQVLSFLKALGIKATRRTVHQLVSLGLTRTPQGFDVDDVIKYVDIAELRKAAKKEKDDLQKLREKKARMELQILDQKSRLLQEKINQVQGKYILKSELEFILSQRALVFRKALQNAIKTYGKKIIECVNGDMDKYANLEYLWEDMSSDLLSTYLTSQIKEGEKVDR